MRRSRLLNNLVVMLFISTALYTAIPAFADYDINAPSSFETSGVVWHSRLDKLFANDDGGRVVEMDRDGTNQTLWNLPGDLEGICVPDPATDRLYVGIEYDGGQLKPAMKEFNITTGTVTRTFYLNLPGATASQGLEALSFVPNATHPQGGEFYVGHQGNGDIYTYDIPIVTGGGSGNTYDYNHTIVTNRTDLAGLHYNSTGKVLYALFDSFNKIQVIRLNGTVIHEFDLAAKAGFSEDEGIGEDDKGYLYIARENGAEGIISVIKNFLDITGPKVVSLNLSDPSPTRAGDVTFTIEFDEPVDKLVAPTVAFGKASPFSVHTVTSLGWVNNTHWQGKYTMDGTTGDGWNNISIRGARDIIGNLMEPDWNHSFLLDTKAPRIWAVELSPQSPVGKGDVQFTIEFDEIVDNSSDPAVTFANSAPFMAHTVTSTGWVNGSVWTGTANISPSTGDGLHHLRIADVVDLANNTMLDDWNNTFIVDTIAPLVVAVGLSDPSPVKAGTVEFTIQFDEVMDTALPPVVTFGPAQPYDSNALFPIGWSNDTTWSGAFNVNNTTGDGLQHIMVRDARDFLGNMMSQDSGHTFEVDATRPFVVSVKMDRTSPMTVGSVNITIDFSEPMDTAIVPLSTFGQDPPYTDYTLTSLGWSNTTHWIGQYSINNATRNGRHLLFVSGAIDAVGNLMLDYVGSGFDIDTSPPSSQVVVFGYYQRTRDFNINWEAYVEGSGLDNIEIWSRFNGAGDFEFEKRTRINQTSGDGMISGTIKFTAPLDGLYEFYSIATDFAGNREPVWVFPDGKTIVDTVRPMVTKVDLYASGPHNSSVNVTIHFSESVNSSTLNVSFGLSTPFNDFQVLGSSTGPDTWDGNIIWTSAVPEGTFTLNILDAYDLAGNPSVPDHSFNFTFSRGGPVIDTTPPSIIHFSYDKEPPVGEGTVNVTVVFSEDMNLTGPLSVLLSSPGGPEHLVNGSWVDRRTWTGSVVVSSDWANGTYTYMVRGGRDRAGNPMLEDKSYTMSVRIDKPLPPGPHPNNGWGIAQWSILIAIIVAACASFGLFFFMASKKKKKEATKNEAVKETPIKDDKDQ